MNKKSIGALLLSAALLVGGTVSTFAYFTNSAQTDIVKFTTGNVKVQFLSDRETNWSLCSSANQLCYGINNEIDLREKSNVKNVAPGDVIKKTFVLQNNGSLDAKVKLALEDIYPKASSSSEGTDYDWCGNSSQWKVYKIKSDGTKENVTLKLEYDNDKHKTYALLDAKTHETLEVEVAVELDKLMTNGANFSNHDKEFGFRVKAYATQWNNPGWTEDGK